MSVLTSTSRRRKHGVLAWVLSLGCTTEPLDAPALDTDGPAASTSDTGDTADDIAFTSSTDETGRPSETSGGSGTTGPDDPGPPEPEAPDDSCLDDLPAPGDEDQVWIAAGRGGVVLRSTDAEHWDPIEVGGQGGLGGSASVGSTFVLAAPYFHIPCWSGASYVCAIGDFVSTAAMTVILVNSYDDTNMVSHASIEFSADLVDWSIAGTWDQPLLFTLVVGDP